MTFWLGTFLFSLALCTVQSYPDSFICTPGWSYFSTTGACYGVGILPPRHTWTNAENYCKGSGAHLASIDTEEEWKHVLSYFYVTWDNTWIDVSAEDGKTWKNHEGKSIDPFKYAKWCANAHGSTSGRRCLTINGFQGTHCFADQDCTTYPARILCKKQIY